MSVAVLSTPRHADHRDPQARARLGALIAALVVLWPLLVLAEFKPWQLFDASNLKVIGGFLGGFVPPATSPEFLRLLLTATLQTVAMATAGIALAWLLALPLAFAMTPALSVSRIGPGAGLQRGRSLRTLARLVLTVLRAVPEIVWALIFVRALGLGPAAGVLAIAITYAGMLGKVYAEILESGESHASATLMRNGSGRMQAFFYALLPQNAAEITSYTVYRWECAIRSSVVLGFVGAGGLGQQMDNSMKMFNGGEVATMLIVFILLVAFADRVSSWLRKEIG